MIIKPLIMNKHKEQRRYEIISRLAYSRDSIGSSRNYSAIGTAIIIDIL
jgi:hypothetical protein